MWNKWLSFRLGMLRVSPMMLGVIPFGLICGANSVEAGLSINEAILMSLIVFAGASQLAVTQLFGTGSSWIVLLFTGIVINLRMLMYSASLSGYLGKESTLKKIGIAYLLTDQAFATSVDTYERDDAQGLHRVLFYFGVAGLMWLTFVLTTAVGAMLGRVIPNDWDLGFSVPLTFLALLMSAISKKEMRTAALIGAGIGLLFNGLPFNLGMILGAVGGIIGGYFFENRNGEWSDE